MQLFWECENGDDQSGEWAPPHPPHFFAVGNYARAVMAPFHFLSEAPFHNCPTCNYCNQLEWEGGPATWLDRPPQVLMHPTIRRKKFFVTIIVYWQNIKFLAYRLVWFPNPLFQVKWGPCLSIDRQKNCSTYPSIHWHPRCSVSQPKVSHTALAVKIPLCFIIQRDILTEISRILLLAKYLLITTVEAMIKHDLTKT